MDVPVLLIGFNRPDQTKQVIDRLVGIGATNVYVAIDGPRKGNDLDLHQCLEVQRIVDSAPWPGSVTKNYRTTNYGCRRGVSEAISWFFEHENEGIILEDDCLPDDTFFEYCRQLLNAFRENPRIGMVSGSTFFPFPEQGSPSYTFTRYPHIWGWATWKRAWDLYDDELASWGGPESLDILDAASGGSRSFVRFWKRLLGSVYSGEIDTWDYVWSYSFWRAGFLSVSPGVNMITNIGFHSQATHTTAKPLGKNFRPDGHPMRLPLTHPPHIEPNQRLEKLTRELAMGVRGKRIRSLLRLGWLAGLRKMVW